MEYLIGFLLIVLLPASIIFNVLLLIRGINFVKQNEKLIDTIREYDDFGPNRRQDYVFKMRDQGECTG